MPPTSPNLSAKLIFPTAEMLERAHIFADLDDDDEAAMLEAFAALVEGTG